MAMDCSWDDDCKREYWDWFYDPDTPPAEKLACAELWSIWQQGICDGGSTGLTQCETESRRDGQQVDVYCLARKRKLAMCFGVCENEVRLVVMGPCEPSTTYRIARQRIRRW